MPQIPSASTPTEVLAGLVERVTFHNSENGFCVLRVKARGQRDLITLVGHAAMISAGEFVQASGAWVNDRTHGVQFRASFLKAAKLHPLSPTMRVARKQSNSRHRVASVSQELLEEVAKPRWIAAAIAPAAVCHSGSLCLMALNVLLGWQLLFPNILKRSLAVDPKIFALLFSPYDPV